MLNRRERSELKSDCDENALNLKSAIFCWLPHRNPSSRRSSGGRQLLL